MATLSSTSKDDSKLIQVVIIAGSAKEAERIAAYTGAEPGTIFCTHEDELRGLEAGRCVFLVGRNARPEFDIPLQFFKKVGAVVLSISLKD